MEKYLNGQGLEFTRLHGIALNYARGYNTSNLEKVAEQKRITEQYEKDMARIQQEYRDDKERTLIKVLRELKIDASPEQHAMYDIFAVYSMLGFAALVKDTNVEQQVDYFADLEKPEVLN